MENSAQKAHSCGQISTAETSSEPFNCSICLELVYKPVVQACGHIFCFWCSFNAMDNQKESQCPVCRRPYMYFPRVCKLLHFLLMKAVPEEYERRNREIQCEEKKNQVFSPTFLESAKNPWIRQECKDNVGSCSQNMDASNYAGATSNCNNDQHSIMGSSQQENIECARGDVGCAQVNTTSTGSMLGVLIAEDFCCALCNGLLYRPVVLNCGEVFCESCLKTSTSEVLHCPSCRAPHPGGSVLICLELHQYLECAFPIEYSKKQLQRQAKNTRSVDLSVGNTAEVGDCKAEGYLHEGVGCDGCGMFPIIGNRYSCEECTEKIGFDLCSTCYANNGSSLGRFNQEHRSNHRMELVDVECYLS